MGFAEEERGCWSAVNSSKPRKSLLPCWDSTGMAKLAAKQSANWEGKEGTKILVWRGKARSELAGEDKTALGLF